MGIWDYLVGLMNSAVAALVWPFYQLVAQADVRYFYIYVLCGLLLAWLNRSKMSMDAGFVGTLLDKPTWTSRSAINDYAIVIINGFLFIVIISALGNHSQILTKWIVGFFRAVGVSGQVNDGTAYLAGFALTIALFVVNDFVCFYLHYLAHRWPVFWEFHKVHHSAEVLNFLTADRAHPLETTVFVVIGGLALAIVNGLFFSFFGDSLTIATVMGANLFVFLENIIGGALRHSPFALRYPKFLEYWLISPAMHHIHHSENERHFDKNMGRALSIWDRLLGTHLYSEDNMRLKFGLGAETKEYRSLYEIYVRPFRQFSKFLPKSSAVGAQNLSAPVPKDGGNAVPWQSKNTTEDNAPVETIADGFMARFSSSPVYLMSSSVVLVLALIWQSNLLGPGAGSNVAALSPAQTIISQAISSQVALTQPAKKSVFLEDLTFAEIGYLLKSGYDSVIIPTGGTEQNGLHMVLGKHNYVVRYTADKIARSAGDILVAPVLSYVPEGNIAAKQGHMGYPGTLSLPEKVFQTVLEYSVRSMKAHGFKTIYLLGDSGGNQNAQRRVAKKLSALWKKDGIKIVHLSDYYAKNGQRDALLAHGFSGRDIGTHAGMTDSSELMFVRPSGVREAMRGDLKRFGSDYALIGYTGRPDNASKALGKQMVELKIKAALAQIKKIKAQDLR